MRFPDDAFVTFVIYMMKFSIGIGIEIGFLPLSTTMSWEGLENLKLLLYKPNSTADFDTDPDFDLEKNHSCLTEQGGFIAIE